MGAHTSWVLWTSVIIVLFWTSDTVALFQLFPSFQESDCNWFSCSAVFLHILQVLCRYFFNENFRFHVDLQMHRSKSYLYFIFSLHDLRMLLQQPGWISGLSHTRELLQSCPTTSWIFLISPVSWCLASQEVRSGGIKDVCWIPKCLRF